MEVMSLEVMSLEGRSLEVMSLEVMSLEEEESRSRGGVEEEGVRYSAFGWQGKEVMSEDVDETVAVRPLQGRLFYFDLADYTSLTPTGPDLGRVWRGRSRGGFEFIPEDPMPDSRSQ